MENKRQLPKVNGEDYAHALVKGGLGVIPGLGPLASEFFALRVGSPLQNRMNEYLQSLYDDIEKLKGQIDAFKDEQLEKNEQFISAVATTSQIAMRTHNTDKLHALRNATLNSVTFEDNEYQQAMFITFIDMFTPLHLKIAKKLNTLGGGTIYESLESIKEFEVESTKINGDLAASIIKDLEARGLVDRIYHSLGSIGKVPPKVGFTFKLSELGKAFYNFITR